MFSDSRHHKIPCPKSLDCDQTVKVLAASDKMHESAPSESIVGNTLFSLNLTPAPEIIDFPEFSEGDNITQYKILIAYALYGSALTRPSEGLPPLHLACSILLLNPLQNQNLMNALREEGITLNKITGEEFLRVVVTNLPADLISIYEKIMDYEAITIQKIALAMFGPYFCLLGKKLNDANAHKWGTKISKALYSALGIMDREPDIGFIFPTAMMAISFHGSIASKLNIKTGIINGILELSKRTGGAGFMAIFVGVILSRLSFTDLGNFRLIDSYILRTNMYMLLWGWVATSMPDLRKAYERFESFGDRAPYLKLITMPNACPEFNNFSIRKLAELSRLIGIIMGQEQLSQVNTGFSFPDPEIVKARIKEVMTAGANALYVWSDVAGSYMASKKDNEQLYNVLSDKEILAKRPEPSAPAAQVVEITR